MRSSSTTQYLRLNFLGTTDPVQNTGLDMMFQRLTNNKPQQTYADMFIKGILVLPLLYRHQYLHRGQRIKCLKFDERQISSKWINPQSTHIVLTIRCNEEYTGEINTPEIRWGLTKNCSENQVCKGLLPFKLTEELLFERI